MTFWATWRMLRDVRRRHSVEQCGPERMRLKALKCNTILPQAIRDECAEKLHKLPKDSRPKLVLNMCQFSGKRRGKIKRFRLSRHLFRDLADHGRGFVKSSSSPVDSKSLYLNDKLTLLNSVLFILLMKLLDIAVLDSGSVMVFVFADGRDHDALAVHRVKRQFWSYGLLVEKKVAGGQVEDVKQIVYLKYQAAEADRVNDLRNCGANLLCENRVRKGTEALKVFKTAGMQVL
ncbi:unnamed protein product [Enterobius vermicularis]|uniref:DUF58 domain-containing protein n=1 Tax=Enterobius vermicularis TaxID=51028 RepID=A0A0N4VL76_ENTVE|nr:unnamed protein product [Enterobius vermicularis]